MLGIVVLNYKNWNVTERCIDSILSSETRGEYRIIVIDNGSNNESVSELKERFDQVDCFELIEIPNNLGFAKANNIGIKRCKELGIEKCILTNSDIVFPVNSIKDMAEAFNGLDDAVIMGPKIINGDDSVMQSSQLSPIRISDEFDIGLIFPRNRIDEVENSGIHKVYTVSGCCFMIDISKFEKMGAFDENTFLYNEENILGVQAQNAGYGTYWNGDVIIKHVHGASSGKRNDFVSIEYMKSKIYYWKQYRLASKRLTGWYITEYFLKMFIVKLFNKNINPFKIRREVRDYWRRIYG